MKQPVVFLAFANDQDQHLALLDEERKLIATHLVPLASAQYFQLFTESAAAIADLSRYIAEFKDRMVLFHYAGHADSQNIFLTDQAADATGVAQLLALQPNLQVVFLNGCSTLGQVELLFQMGIPAVIATKVPIADPSARNFANNFYLALAKEHTLEEAFKLAAADYLMASGQAVAIYRGIQRQGTDPNAMPWGLYVNAGKEAVLRWKLPRESTGSFIVRGAALKYQAGATMNQNLIETIANSIAPYSPKIRLLIDPAVTKGKAPKIRDLRVAVIDSFPTPIGIHLRKLLISEDISTDRLQKIVTLYQVSAQFLAFTLLAQLWDEQVHRASPLHLKPEQQATLAQFFALDKPQSSHYNFTALIQLLGDVFAQNDVQPYVEEFAQLRETYQQQEPLRQAVAFLEEMKGELLGAVAADEIESFCVQAEKQLAFLFKHIGFSAKYTLATIKTIELLKVRHNTPQYRHHLVVLNQLTAAIGVLDDVLVAAEFAENNSVILMRDEETIQPSLNLSPLVIDENALSGQQNSKLFFFTAAAKDQLDFTLVDNLKDELCVKEDTYPYIRELFSAFRQAVSPQ